MEWQDMCVFIVVAGAWSSQISNEEIPVACQLVVVRALE